MTAQDSSEIGFSVGDKYSFVLSLQENNYYYGPEDSFRLGENATSPFYITQGVRFDIFVKSFEASETHKVETLYSAQGSNETVSVSIRMNSLFIYKDWEYYSNKFQEEVEIQAMYSSDQTSFVGQSEDEYILQHNFADSDEPIGTGEAVQYLDYEIRYELETGVLTYLKIAKRVDADFGSYQESTILHRIGYDYVDRSDLDVTPFSKTPEIVSFPLLPVVAVVVPITCVRMTWKK